MGGLVVPIGYKHGQSCLPVLCARIVACSHKVPLVHHSPLEFSCLAPCLFASARMAATRAGSTCVAVAFHKMCCFFVVYLAFWS